MNESHDIVGLTIADVADGRFGALLLVMTDGSRWRVSVDASERVTIDELDADGLTAEAAEMAANVARVIEESRAAGLALRSARTLDNSQNEGIPLRE